MIFLIYFLFLFYLHLVMMMIFKNNTAAAKDIQKATGYANSAASSEFSRYLYFRRLLIAAGVNVDEGKDTNIQGVSVKSGAKISLSPSFGITSYEIRSKFQVTDNASINITPKSTLILDGDNITIGNLDLDGTLIIKACKGAHVYVNNLQVHNNGWDMSAVREHQKKKKISKLSQSLEIRGFRLNRNEQFTKKKKKKTEILIF